MSCTLLSQCTDLFANSTYNKLKHYPALQKVTAHLKKGDAAGARKIMNRTLQEATGILYLKGIFHLGGENGFALDYKKAFELFSKASHSGLADAQIELSALYYLGKGTQKDVKLSQYWMNQSLSNGLDSVKNRALPPQIKARVNRYLAEKERTHQEHKDFLISQFKKQNNQEFQSRSAKHRRHLFTSHHKISNPAADRQQVSCKWIQKDQGKLTVIVAFGQSNSTNWGPTPYTPQKKWMYDFKEGRCYVAKDPLLWVGDNSEGGSVWTRLSDLLISRGYTKNVLIASVGAGSTSVENWEPGRKNHARVIEAIQSLKEQGFEIDMFLWHQGESDTRYSGHPLKADQYRKSFMKNVEDIRRHSKAPIFVCMASRLGPHVDPEVQKGQQEIVKSSKDIFAGPDTDEGLKLLEDRQVGGTHFSDKGMKKYAEMWYKAITNPGDQFIKSAF